MAPTGRLAGAEMPRQRCLWRHWHAERRLGSADLLATALFIGLTRQDRFLNVRLMHLSHLGLPVRDVGRSQRFYTEYFGFDPATAQRYDDGTVIIRNGDGFDLALHATGDVGVPQPFLHFGFRLAAGEDVRTVLGRARADGLEIIEHDDDPGMVSFKCLDPDGHRIEVYWEP